jgi:hypothetical protein
MPAGKINGSKAAGCEVCASRIQHKTWVFDFMPYNITTEVTAENGIRIYREGEDILVDPPDSKERWALCSVLGCFTEAVLTHFNWSCRLHDRLPDDPADEEYMTEISE